MSKAPRFWNIFRRLASGAKQRSRRSHAPRPMLSLESLEQRRALSVSPNQIELNNSNLYIYGDADADTATVSELPGGNVRVRLESDGESLSQDFVKAQVTRIIFFGRDGDDEFSNLTDLEARAYGEGGNDTLVGGSGNDELDGGDGDDTLNGREGSDVLAGKAGNDALFGEAGNDTLFGHEGNDRLYGGDGADVLWGSTGHDYMEGQAGNDKLFGEVGNDTIAGGSGDDELDGGDGDDTLGGGEDNDILAGKAGVDLLLGDFGNDTLYGHDGDDKLYGGEGADVLWGGNQLDYLDGQAGDDKLFGEADADLLVGGDGKDQLAGGDGGDTLEGGLGDDLLSGEFGDDRLFGDAGNDTLYGHDGSDTLYGGEGADIIWGGSDSDYLDGQAGDDKLYGEGGEDSLVGGADADELDGGDDDDSLSGEDGNDVLAGRGGADSLFGGAGNDTLYGHDGNDKLYGDEGADALWGGNDRDYLDGQSGSDRLYGEGGNDSLVGGTEADELDGGDGDDALQGGFGNDTLSGGLGDDRIYGDDGNDYLSGSTGNDIVMGGAGNDELRGGAGRDYLHGQVGDDFLYGEADNDSVVGGAGNDQLFGGDGNDGLAGGLGNDTLSGGLGDDWLWGDEGDDFLFGQDGNDTLRGGLGGDELSGGNGSDMLEGGQDRDVLFGDAGSDTLLGGEGADHLQGGDDDDNLAGGLGDDELYGQLGDDLLWGEQGNDVLLGGDGSDILWGGEEADELNGGSGNDALYGQAGADNLIGEIGDDLLSGGLEDDSLLGGDGNDVLQGDEGRDFLGGQGGADVLIGGDGVDSLMGSAGEDLLIGGIVSHDTAKMQLLSSRWGSTSSYAERIQAIEDESFAAYLKNEETVLDDYVTDSITGGTERDWIFVPGSASIYDPTGHHHGDMGGGGHHSVHVIDHLPVVEGFDLLDSLDELRDRETGETVTTLISHADSPSKRTEHLSLFELVRYDQVTHYAMHSGNWSDPSIWHDGVVPTTGARVLIPIGVQVEVDKVINSEIATLRIDGTLSFATQVNTQLRVDTAIVSDVGTLVIGTASNPIAANVTARMVFTDNGVINRGWDPFGISRGLITHGSVEMHGAAKSSSVELAGSALFGASSLQLKTVPTGWRAGDKIAIAGTSASGNQSEERTILGIYGNRVFIEPLQYDHLTLTGGQSVHIANLTRNIVLESEATEIARRGHVMFMHNPNVHIANVQLHRLGRSDKSEVVNDSQVDDNWNLVPGTGTNQRARYALHFHRTGTNASASPATVEGSVVTDNAGWGYVNHSSYVDFTNNVAYNVTGAGFVTEVGDEIGTFRGNIAINMKASGDHIESRVPQQDHGHTGDGFWFQGTGISVINNVAANAEGHAFIFFSRSLPFPGNQAQFSAANLADPTIAGGSASIPADDVPVREFSGNVGYSSGIGLSVWYNLRLAQHNGQSVFRDSLFWNNETGVEVPYARNIVLRNLTILHDFSTLSSFGVNSNDVSKNITYDNLTVSGYYVGIEAAKRGYSIVNGGAFGTLIGVSVHPPSETGRRVFVQGAFTMIPLPSEILRGAIQKEVSQRFVDTPVSHTPSVNHVFYDSKVFLNYGPYRNQQLYSAAQVATAVPFPVAKDHVAPQYVGLTTQQLKNQFGLTVHGEIAPATAQIVPTLGGLLQLVP